MIKLLHLLSEIRISTVQNCLPTLLRLQSEIKTSRDLKDQRLAAVRCAELVLPIWEEKYPNDKRARTCIEVTKKFLAGEASKEQLQTVRDAAYDAANDAAYAAYAVAAAAATAAADYTAYAANAANNAILAVKKYFNLKENLNEIKIQTGFPEKGKIYKIKNQYQNVDSEIIAGSTYESCFLKYLGIEIKDINKNKYFVFEYTGFTVYGALPNMCPPKVKTYRKVDFWSEQEDWFKEVYKEDLQ